MGGCSRVNDAMHATYADYIRTVADTLLLRDWEIELKREWADDGAYAQAVVWHRENHLQVKIAEGFDGHPATERREWLTHELLHAHFGRTDQAVEHLTDTLSDNDAIKLFKAQINDEEEICVQRLARILAPFMPLPPEITE
jgi:hypothetical protein